MDEKMEIHDFLNLINIKSQLINFDEKKLIELYKDDYEHYTLFLNSVGILLNNEPGFLLFDESYMDKIRTVMELHRFTSADSEVKDLINQIIIAFNAIDKLPEEEKAEYKYEYVLEQEALRDAGFYTEEEFIYSLNFDSFLAYALQKSELDYLRQCDDDMTVMSINYMMELCPEFFYDSEVEKNAIMKLDSIATNMGKRREKMKIYSEKVGKVLRKVFGKEE